MYVKGLYDNFSWTEHTFLTFLDKLAEKDPNNAKTVNRIKDRFKTAKEKDMTIDREILAATGNDYGDDMDWNPPFPTKSDDVDNTDWDPPFLTLSEDYEDDTDLDLPFLTVSESYGEDMLTPLPIPPAKSKIGLCANSDTCNLSGCFTICDEPSEYTKEIYYSPDQYIVPEPSLSIHRYIPSKEIKPFNYSKQKDGFSFDDRISNLINAYKFLLIDNDFENHYYETDDVKYQII